MSRMPPLDPAAMTADQQRVAAEIAGARKNVRGPFPMWLRNPKLAEHANQFGVALRDHSVIGRRIFELAVITVCRARSVQYAWSSHAPQAELQGIAPDIVAADYFNFGPAASISFAAPLPISTKFLTNRAARSSALAS